MMNIETQMLTQSREFFKTPKFPPNLKIYIISVLLGVSTAVIQIEAMEKVAETLGAIGIQKDAIVLRNISSAIIVFPFAMRLIFYVSEQISEMLEYSSEIVDQSVIDKAKRLYFITHGVVGLTLPFI